MISILLATHNPQIEFFEECLDSIEKQTYKDYELVIVDDGTNNCSIDDILEKHKINYRIYRTEFNCGLPKALNYGLKFCQGEYIARMDDDDIMLPTRLEKQLELAQKTNGFVFSNTIVFNSDGSEARQTNLESIDIKKYLKRSGNCLTHSTLFVKKKILDEINGYDERFIYAQDYALYMKCIDKYDFVCVPDVLLKYRSAINRSPLQKKIMSILNCYAAAVNYFCQNRSAENTFFMIRRSASIIKQMWRMYKTS